MSTENIENKEEHKHHNIIKDIIEKVEDVLENMDTDFPLSGGEEHVVHHHPHPHAEEAPKTEEHHHSAIGKILDNINTDFPLSGGEE